MALIGGAQLILQTQQLNGDFNATVMLVFQLLTLMLVFQLLTLMLVFQLLTLMLVFQLLTHS